MGNSVSVRATLIIVLLKEAQMSSKDVVFVSRFSKTANLLYKAHSTASTTVLERRRFVKIEEDIGTFAALANGFIVIITGQ